MATMDGANAEWEGVKRGALSNALRQRLHTLVDELDPLRTDRENGKVRGEIAALLELFPRSGDRQ